MEEQGTGLKRAFFLALPYQIGSDRKSREIGKLRPHSE
jgi:hypothetical protein